MAQVLQEHQERVHDGNTATQLGDLYPGGLPEVARTAPQAADVSPVEQASPGSLAPRARDRGPDAPRLGVSPGPRGTVARPAADLVDTLAATAPPGAEQGAASGGVLGERLHAARSPHGESVPSCPGRGAVLPPPGMAP